MPHTHTNQLEDRVLRNSSGSFAIFAAIRRASSLLSNLAAESSAGLILEIDVAQRLTVDVAHDVA